MQREVPLTEWPHAVNRPPKTASPTIVKPSIPGKGSPPPSAKLYKKTSQPNMSVKPQILISISCMMCAKYTKISRWTTCNNNNNILASINLVLKHDVIYLLECLRMWVLILLPEYPAEDQDWIYRIQSLAPGYWEVVAHHPRDHWKNALLLLLLLLSGHPLTHVEQVLVSFGVVCFVNQPVVTPIVTSSS